MIAVLSNKSRTLQKVTHNLGPSQKETYIIRPSHHFDIWAQSSEVSIQPEHILLSLQGSSLTFVNINFKLLFSDPKQSKIEQTYQNRIQNMVRLQMALPRMS